MVVVGNLWPGGTGKTPIVMALVKGLQSQGFKVGVLSRGHGRTSDATALIRPNSLASEVGDEPLLIHRNSQAPVAVGRSRVAAAQLLLRHHPEVQVLICDDGLQHLQLAHDLALVVMDERGLGNGISILIFAGIAAGLPNALGGLLELVRTGAMSILVALFIVVLVVLVTYFVVFVERGQRKILVNYARRQVGNKVYGGQSSHLPLKLNMAGVIPPIFASSIILLPATVVSWFSSGDSMRWLKDIASALSPGQPVYILLYVAAIVFFCFFYTALVFNSRETADNLKKSGAFIPGIRPGDQTARYIDKILVRLTLAGAVYIAFVCLLPEFLILKYNVPFYFGGTSLLIIVVVTMDFMSQVQNYMMSQQYESLLKKANFKTTMGA